MVGKKVKLSEQEVEFYKVEIDKVLDALLSLHNLRVQVGGIFATLVFAALGVAFNSQKAGVLFVAGSIQWVFVYLDRLIRLTANFYYLRRIQLQRRLMPNDPDAFAGTSYSLGSKSQKHLLEMADVLDIQERNKVIKSAIGLGQRSFAGFWLPLISSLLDIGLGLYLYLIGGWSLF